MDIKSQLIAGVRCRVHGPRGLAISVHRYDGMVHGTPCWWT